MSLDGDLYCPNTIKCPNCGEDKEIKGQCECGYGYGGPINIGKTLKEETKEIIEPKNKRFIFQNGNYGSYSINIQKNGKIKSIEFKFGKEKFIIHLIDYYLDEVEDINPYSSGTNILKIRDLKIGPIAKKVKNGYSEYKDRINDFRHLGLNYKNCKIFIEGLLKNYYFSIN